LAAGNPYLALASVPEALDANGKPALTMARQKKRERLREQDQKEFKALKKELQGKEKALA
jgi:hypothetical protein